jgi:hypothetical protein
MLTWTQPGRLIVHAFAELAAMRTREWHTEPVAERNQTLPNFRLKQDDDRDTDIKQPIA